MCASRRSSRFFTNLYAGQPAFFMGRPHLHSGRPVRTGQEVRGSSSNRSNFLIFEIFVEKICFTAFFEDPGCTKGNSQPDATFWKRISLYCLYDMTFVTTLRLVGAPKWKPGHAN